MTIGIDEHILGEPLWLSERVAISFSIVLLGVLPLITSKNEPTSPSSIFIIFQLAFVHVPSCALCAVHPNLPISFILMTAIVLVAIGLLVHPVSKIVNIDLPIPVKVIIAIPVILWMFYSVAIYFKAILESRFSFGDVFNMEVLYDFRETVFSKFSGKELSALSGLGYFLFPLFAIITIEHKKFKYLSFLTIAIVMLYAITGMKTYVIISVFTSIVYLLARHHDIDTFCSLFLIILMLMLLFMNLLGLITESPWPLAIFFKRGVMIPGELHILYGDHFANIARIPIWKIFDTNVQDFRGIGLQELILIEVLGGTIGSGEGANTGMIATSFARYGILGVVTHSSIMIAILAYMNHLAALGNKLWIPFAAIPSLFILTNSDLIAAGLWYGLGFSLVLSLCMGEKVYESFIYD